LAQNSDSNDRYMAAIDFIITFLRAHEKKIDKLTGQLGTIVDEIGSFEGLNKKLDSLNKGIDNLEKQMTTLSAFYYNYKHSLTSK